MQLSIILPVYNCANYISLAVDSLLEQTFTDFELLILNDASIDETLSIIKGYTDPRVKIYNSSENKGLVFQLNKGLAIAKGEYIARMDGDDICVNNRFEKQIDYLKRNTDIAIVGCNVNLFSGKTTNSIGSWNYPYGNEECQARLLFYPCHAHPAVMFRKTLVDDGLFYYKTEYNLAEDYELWSRLSGSCKSSNIQEQLLHYRISETQVSSLKKTAQQKLTNKIRIQNLQKYYKLSLKEKELLSRCWLNDWLNSWEEVVFGLNIYASILEQSNSKAFKVEIAKCQKQIVNAVFKTHPQAFSWYEKSAAAQVLPLSTADRAKNFVRKHILFHLHKNDAS